MDGRYDTRRVRVAFLVNDLQLSGGIGVVVAPRPPASRCITAWTSRSCSSASRRTPHWRATSTSRTCTSPRSTTRARSTSTSRSPPGGRPSSRCSSSTPPATRTSCRASRTASTDSDEAERLGAALTLDLPVAFITEARWIATRSASCAPTPPATWCATGSTRTCSAPAERRAERPTARCGCSSRATPTSGSRASTRRSRPPGDARAERAGRRRGDARRARRDRRRRGRRPAQPARDGRGLRADRRGAQALERRGHVRARRWRASTGARRA